MLRLAAGLCALAALNGGLRAVRPDTARPAPSLAAETAVESAGLLSVGMRRLAADLGLLRLLVYYGTEEAHDERAHDHDHQAKPFDPAHPERAWGGGRYPELGPRARRVLELDPDFSYVAIFASSALAFNLNRPGEALDLLQWALQRDPRNLQYRAYVAAIGFHRRGDVQRVLALLEPMLDEPDCPTMIKSMVAFMHKRAGRRDKAARIYRGILESSRDPGYRALARRALREMGFPVDDAH